jgi:signal transduction histidine kinase
MEEGSHPDRWPAKRLLFGLVAFLMLISTGAVASAAVAMTSLSDARVLVLDQIGPARRMAQTLSASVLNQETGVRGYVLTGSEEFLQPYRDGQGQETALIAESRARLNGTLPELRAKYDRLEELMNQWRAEYAEPTIASIRTTGPALEPVVDTDRGKARFDDVRATLQDVQKDLEREGDAARDALNRSASAVMALLVGTGVVLVLLIVAVAIVLHRILIAPLAGLAAQVRQVASGDFQRNVNLSGPREIVELSHDVDQMRQRIVQELEASRSAHEQLDERSRDLQRSNAELEQFAYVASHDLQEPLRKVASFCQLLERRYGGQLDERADQYIGFAVDGAKRMQVLINDLLAFSRVGRLTREQTVVPSGDLVAQVLGNAADQIEEIGAEVVVGELPPVRGEASLLTAVFQNLIGNALKFRGEEPLRVEVRAQRTDDFWTFTVSDNGIGIDAEYAERIFVIFQRLHHKDAYPGTGIGLAMCRKIIEYHGGTIRLNTESDTGTTFEFTLPVVEESETSDD